MDTLILLLILVAVVVVARLLAARWKRSRRLAVETSNISELHNHTDVEFDDVLLASGEPQDAFSGAPDNDLGRMHAVMQDEVEREELPKASIRRDAAPEQSQAYDPVTNKQRHYDVDVSPEQIIVLNVVAPAQQFEGPAILEAVARTGMEHGDMGIFHYTRTENTISLPMFSMANMLKPGAFDLEQMDSFSTTGLSLFMIPDGHKDDIERFETMLHTAQSLAHDLGGELRDGRRSVLTRQTIDHMRERITERSRFSHAMH